MIDAPILARKLFLGASRYSGASSLAEPLLGGVGAILMLHRVSSVNMSPLGINAHLSVAPGFLDRVLADLRRRGTAILTLDEMLAKLAAGTPGRAVAITADDAYLDNLTEALPVFEAHDAPFTVYVAPGLVDGSVVPWWETLEELVARSDTVRLPAGDRTETLSCATSAQKLEALARLTRHVTTEVAEEDQQAALRRIGAVDEAHERANRRFMNWDEVRRLSGHRLATIGAHTVHHYNLSRLAAETALDEMRASAAAIEAETGARPRHFAYPYGYPAAVGQRETELARDAGFASAVTTRHGVLHAEHAAHPHALPRISINGHYQRIGYMRAMLAGISTPMANRGKRFVTL